MTSQISSKLRVVIDRVEEDPGVLFTLLFILVLSYLLFQTTLCLEQTINSTWDFLSNAFYLLVIGVVLRFLSPNEARFVLKHTYTFLFFGFFSILAGSLFITSLHPLQAPLEIANTLAFYLLVVGFVAGLFSHLMKMKEDKSRHRKMKIGYSRITR